MKWLTNALRDENCNLGVLVLIGAASVYLLGLAVTSVLGLLILLICLIWGDV